MIDVAAMIQGARQLAGRVDRALRGPRAKEDDLRELLRESTQVLRLQADALEEVGRGLSSGAPATTGTKAAPRSRATPRSTSPGRSLRGNADAVELVMQTAQEIKDPTFPLVEVPALVRALSNRLPMDEVHRALFEANKRGLLELRPDGGSEFLKPENARLCPPGGPGVVFSRFRITS